MKNLSLSGWTLAAALASTAWSPLDATAADVIINVSGIVSSEGQIGCSLFKSPAGFPMDSSAARQIWRRADREGVVCTFSDVPNGRYAASVAHDLNGNKTIDTNVLGIPTEAWGVSRNVRPTLRAPRWDEAVFEVAQDRVVSLDIRVAR